MSCFTLKITIIRKQIKPKNNAEKNFRQEEHILSCLRCLEHPNIIQLLTAFTIHQSHYFLFPLADGDLKDFLGNDGRLPGFETDHKIMQALYELASAIEAVHNYFSATFNLHMIGCHYDLKPDNILYRQDKFILSDFGLSRLTREEKGSQSLYRNGGAEYWAPECHAVDEGFKKLYVGRSSDMWSFGCILSEVLTYLQQGSAGVKEFSSRREVILAGFLSCKLFHEGNKPSEEVRQWLSRLGSWPSATKSQKRLLVLIEHLLQQDPDARPKAHDATLLLFCNAQDEVYQTVNFKFEQLSQQSDLEMKIEYQRFRICGEILGFGCLGQASNIISQQMARPFRDMQRIRSCMAKLQLEVEKLSAVLISSEAKSYRSCFHLQKILDDVWDMQAPMVREQMAKTLENRILSTENGDSLMTTEVANQILDTSSLDGSRTLYRRIGLLAAMKRIATALGNRGKSQQSMLLDEGRIRKPPRDFHWYRLSTLQEASGVEQQVLIERLEYDGSWYKRKDELIQRVEDISSFRAPLAASHIFPVLTSAGYYHDLGMHSFRIVYYLPRRQPEHHPSASKIENLKSLRDVMLKTKSRTQRPSLDQVFDTSLKMLNVVLTMHKAGWFHKSISSYNIIFFPDRFSCIVEAITEPYFIGFGYSRLNDETAFTQGPSEQLDYQHPEYLKGLSRFCHKFEYYSVGLVLLELGLWSPLGVMTRNVRGSPAEMLEFLLETEVPKLKTYMGVAYEEAVAACLKGDFGDSSDPIQVLEAFEQQVLLKVERPTLTPISSTRK